MSDLKIGEYTLHLTCWACPEQYDVYRGDEEVAYFRLRHGCFTVDCGDERVFSACPYGDGRFKDDERQKFLEQAIAAVDLYYKAHAGGN